MICRQLEIVGSFGDVANYFGFVPIRLFSSAVMEKLLIFADNNQET
jgi:hypothetical protein